MKRYTVIKHFMDLLHENDILIFSGSERCKEAYQYKNNNCLSGKGKLEACLEYG